MGREFRKSHELIMHCWRDTTPIFSDGVGRPDVLRFKPVGKEREHEIFVQQQTVRLLLNRLRDLRTKAHQGLQPGQPVHPHSEINDHELRILR